MILLIYSSLLGLLFFLNSGAQSSEAAALVTIGEIYSMNGKKDEARKATNGWMGSPWISPKG